MKVDGVDYWRIDVPGSEPALRDPAYVELVLLEKMAYPRVITRRFAPTLYTVEVGGHLAAATSVDSPGLAVPVCRDLAVLRAAFFKPEKGQTPKFPKLNTEYKILRTLKRMLAGPGNIVGINYYVGAIAEHFDLQHVVNCLADNKS